MNYEYRSRGAASGAPDWWARVPAGERTLLRAIARMLRSAKRSQLQEVARAAAKWERGLGCFIKVRLMHEGSRRKGSFRVGKRPRMIDSGWVRIEGRPQANGGAAK